MACNSAHDCIKPQKAPVRTRVHVCVGSFMSQLLCIDGSMFSILFSVILLWCQSLDVKNVHVLYLGHFTTLQSGLQSKQMYFTQLQSKQMPSWTPLWEKLWQLLTATELLETPCWIVSVSIWNFLWGEVRSRICQRHAGGKGEFHFFTARNTQNSKPRNSTEIEFELGNVLFFSASISTRTTRFWHKTWSSWSTCKTWSSLYLVARLITSLRTSWRWRIRSRRRQIHFGNPSVLEILVQIVSSTDPSKNWSTLPRLGSWFGLGFWQTLFGRISRMAIGFTFGRSLSNDIGFSPKSLRSFGWWSNCTDRSHFECRWSGQHRFQFFSFQPANKSCSTSRSCLQPYSKASE